MTVCTSALLIPFCADFLPIALAQDICNRDMYARLSLDCSTMSVTLLSWYAGLLVFFGAPSV